jgi:prepilin-type processing-associated H-X9-DG protein
VVAIGRSKLTNGTPILNGVLVLTRNQPAGWTHELHNRAGNVLLSDGSVQQLGNSRLQAGLRDSGTNRLAMP